MKVFILFVGIDRSGNVSNDLCLTHIETKDRLFASDSFGSDWGTGIAIFIELGAPDPPVLRQHEPRPDC